MKLLSSSTSILLIVVMITMVIIVTSSSSSSFTSAYINSDKVTSLPDFPPLLSSWYSGLINITSTIDGKTRRMYYLFMEATQVDPKTAPVFLATSNGPGCSSDSYNFMETGPYTIRLGGTWTKNNFSFNNRVNMLYVDMPAGVGFSVDWKKGGTVWTDELSNDINYLFLKQWYKSYPEFASNDFYINGISYSGHYSPGLAWAILKGDDDEMRNRMKGFLLGSPCIGTGFRDGPLADLDWCFTTGENADPMLPDYFRDHSYLPFQTSLTVNPNPLLYANPPWDEKYYIYGEDIYWLVGPDGYYCEDAIQNPGGGKKGGSGSGGKTVEERNEMLKQRHSKRQEALKNLKERNDENQQEENQQQPLSLYSKLLESKRARSVHGARRHQERIAQQQQQQQQDRSAQALSSNTNDINNQPPKPTLLQPDPRYTNTNTQLWKLPVAPYEPCSGEFLANYLRRPDVQKALHVNMEGETWMDCADPKTFSYPTPNTTRGMKKEYFEFMNNTDWKMMIVSGTEEVSVNFAQTQTVISSFGREPISDYTTWYYADPLTGLWEQLGGWYIVFDRISWASIIGAGHSAAMTSPAKMYQLLVSFLENDGRPGMAPVCLNESVRDFYGIQNDEVEDARNNALASSKDEQEQKLNERFGTGFGIGFVVAFVLVFVAFGLLRYYEKSQANKQNAILSAMGESDDGGLIGADDSPGANQSRDRAFSSSTVSRRSGYNTAEDANAKELATSLVHNDRSREALAES